VPAASQIRVMLAGLQRFLSIVSIAASPWRRRLCRYSKSTCPTDAPATSSARRFRSMPLMIPIRMGTSRCNSEKLAVRSPGLEMHTSFFCGIKPTVHSG
jgi:hypothetical protein